MDNLEFADVEALEENLSEPSQALVDDLKEMEGDWIFVGAGGKMGPTMVRMASKALERAGTSAKVFAVSRFSDAQARKSLDAHGIETIAADVLDREAVGQLPAASNVVFMLGMKFGLTENPSLAWAMNTQAPAYVAERFAQSRIVAFSSGNVYPYLPADSAGATEETIAAPVGEYGWSLLGRERAFEHFSRTHGTKVAIVRLNYAVETRYGILVDLAQRILAKEPVDLTAGHVNLIWQRDANEHALRCIRLAASPPTILNVTGHETLAVMNLALRLGEALGVEPQFMGREAATALLNDASKSHALFGLPTTSTDVAVGAVAAWLKAGLPTLDKPTKFEVRDGKF
ncbi:MAG: epimerase [Opitutae bacterium]|nr:epimerase [Opitutae bacterium]|tara:strand:+ start:15449 stop:16480 length:1032 start_codon:yes stop_codon:yes gene_type:complete